MALAALISETIYESLSDALKGEYKKTSDGGYVLDVVGIDNVSILASTLERAKQERNEAKTALKEIADKSSKLESDNNKLKGQLEAASGDVETARKTWEEQHVKEIGQLKDENGVLTKLTKKSAIDNAIGSLVSELSTVPKLLRPILERAVTAEISQDGSVFVRLVDENGNVRKDASGNFLGVDVLRAEILANEDFKPILKGTGAGGGGAGGGKGGGGAASSDNPFIRGANFNMTRQSELRMSDPAKAKQLMEAAEIVNKSPEGQKAINPNVLSYSVSKSLFGDK